MAVTLLLVLVSNIFFISKFLRHKMYTFFFSRHFRYYFYSLLDLRISYIISSNIILESTLQSLSGTLYMA